MLFYPPPIFRPKLKLARGVPLRELCAKAGVSCRASGAWTERQVEVATGQQLEIWAEPGDWGAVRIEVPNAPPAEQARMALLAMAYGLHDLVAKQSVAHQPWARLKPPRGRPPTGQALTTAERQRRFRKRGGVAR